MKRYGTIMIVIGMLLASYPLLDRAYTWYMQREIERTYGELDAVFTSEPENVTPPPTAGTPAEVIPPPATTETQTTPAAEPAPPVPAPAEPKPAPVKKPVPKPVGVLKIAKIDLKLPILKGATAANMRIGAAWLSQTTAIGQTGNTAISAHRSHTKGRFFNRLDEVGIGDEIVIIADGIEYRYTVFNKVVVEPTDVSVLRRSKNSSVLTLITCTPLYTATHRLIVQAKLIN